MLRSALTFVVVVAVPAGPLWAGQAVAQKTAVRPSSSKAPAATSSGRAAVARDEPIPVAPAPDPMLRLRDKLGPVGLALIPPAASLERKRWLAEWQKRVTVTVRARQRQRRTDLDEVLGLEPIVPRRPTPCRVILTVENRSWYRMAFRGTRTSRAPETALAEGLGTIDAWQVGVGYTRIQLPKPEATDAIVGLPRRYRDSLALPLRVTWAGMPRIRSAKRRKQARDLVLQLVLRLDLNESLSGKGRFNSQAALELPRREAETSRGMLPFPSGGPNREKRRSTAQETPKPIRRSF